ncbi:thioredoxin isoform X2 [Nematostella vectensis]|uniref:thioredoxin isoform X2 n=1 Tax=Nematostella vectensis TaxID=45351 RepID=UPI0013903C1B|nr:thioredoxin isoform X2 [Nematostella vectensis]
MFGRNKNAGNKVKEIEERAEFNSVINNTKDKLVVIDFYAEWCGPCRQIKPKFKKMALEEFKDVFFAKIDVDELELEKLVGANEVKLRELILKYK